MPDLSRYLGLLTVLFVAHSLTVLATETRFSARVIGVTDGDTITVLRDQLPVKIRIFGIDCPERGQAFGKSARHFTSELTFGHVVFVEQRTTDQYGRMVANLIVGGQDVGLALVRAGYAWHVKHYSQDLSLAAAEQEARAARRGLWRDTHPVAPWEYRSPRLAREAEMGTPSGLVDYHGNANSRVFHGPNCPQYNCTHCVVLFASTLAARVAGFRPDTKCIR